MLMSLIFYNMKIENIQGYVQLGAIEDRYNFLKVYLI